jgi:hypothetical protein
VQPVDGADRRFVPQVRQAHAHVEHLAVDEVFAEALDGLLVAGEQLLADKGKPTGEVSGTKRRLKGCRHRVTFGLRDPLQHDREYPVDLLRGKLCPRQRFRRPALRDRVQRGDEASGELPYVFNLIGLTRAQFIGNVPICQTRHVLEDGSQLDGKRDVVVLGTQVLDDGGYLGLGHATHR